MPRSFSVFRKIWDSSLIFQFSIPLACIYVVYYLAQKCRIITLTALTLPFFFFLCLVFFEPLTRFKELSPTFSFCKMPANPIFHTFFHCHFLPMQTSLLEMSVLRLGSVLISFQTYHTVVILGLSRVLDLMTYSFLVYSLILLKCILQQHPDEG